MKRILILAVALVVYGSLYPWQFDAARAGGVPPWLLLHGWPARLDRFAVRDAVLNVLLYIPIGMAAFLTVARKAPKRAAAAAGLLLAAALSFAMETLQVYIPGRDASLMDVATNCAGGAIGVLAAAVFRRRIEARAARYSGTSAGGAAWLLGFWGIAQWYPFFPALGRTRLRLAIDALLTTHLPPGELLERTAEWFVAGLAIGAVAGGARYRIWAAAAVALALREVLATPPVTAAEAAGALLAAILLTCLPGQRRGVRAGLFLMAAAIVVYELSPFHFSAPAGPFVWVPFVATFSSDRTAAILVLARKAFDYGALLWLLRREGAPPLAAAAGVAAALLALEGMQCYLPGRTPETTDAVLALLVALLLQWRKGAGRPPVKPEQY